MRSQREILGSNLQRLLDRKGVDQKILAGYLGVSEASVSNWTSGEKYPRIGNIQKMADYFGVKKSDLIEVKEERAEYITNQSDMYKFFPAPVSAGELTTIEAVAPEQIKMPDEVMGKYAGNEDIFFLRVNGQSMNKVIPHQSLIAVKKIEIEELKDDDIVVFSNGHEYSVKRFYNDKENKRLVFKSESTDRGFIDHPIDYSRTDDLVIHGKVVLYIVKP